MDLTMEKISFIGGGFRCVMSLPWLKSSIMVLNHTSRDYTQYDIPTDSNDWVHMTLNTKYLHADWWICSSKHLTNLGWFQICDDIAMVQA